jgi:hypothetical protein
MGNMQFRLSNKIGQEITLSMEPEGTILELADGKSVLIELCSDQNPVLDLQINKENDGIYLSIWPEQGGYKVIE